MSPLDEGDRFEIDVQAGPATDVVLVTVPNGKGLALAYWINRQFTETPELRLSRREQDHLAVVQRATA